MASNARRLLASLADWLGARGGFSALCIALLLGLLAAAALPPYYALPLVVAAFTGLVWLLDAAGRAWRPFLISWFFAFGFFLAGLYWVAEAFFVEAERFGAVAPFAVAGLSALLAFFHALTLWAARRWLWQGAARVVALAGAWILAELVRGWIFTGFPWNLIGSVWAFSDTMLQPAALLGVWGLGFITLLAAGAPAIYRGVPLAGRERVLAPLSLLLLLSATGFGIFRLEGAAPLSEDRVEGVHLRIVQPNIAQVDKWQRDLRLEHVRRQLQMSVAPPSESGRAPTHVIWSETAIPFLLDRSQGLLGDLGRAAPAGGLLIAGAPRGESSSDRYWNSLFAIAPGGRVAATYDKSHLVPFGEYVPLKGLIGWSKLVAGRADFSRGGGPVTLDLEGLPPLSPLICYEIIFPTAVVPAEGPRPQWLLNLTNDNWFGVSSGPYQHLVAARLRAVEEGLPVVRAANGGISAVIDAYGRVRKSLPLSTSGVLDADLPRPASAPPPFARLQLWSLGLLLFGALGAFFATRSR